MDKNVNLEKFIVSFYKQCPTGGELQMIIENSLREQKLKVDNNKLVEIE